MKKYIPNQHGAWAMLVLPFLFGVAASRGQLIHIPLFVCWLLIYLFSFPLLQGVKTRKFKRYAQPLKLYGILLLPLIIYLVAAEPVLLWFVLPLVPLFAVNLYYARTKNERALLNDISAIVAFCLIIYPVFYVGQGGAGRLRPSCSCWPCCTSQEPHYMSKPSSVNGTITASITDRCSIICWLQQPDSSCFRLCWFRC